MTTSYPTSGVHEDGRPAGARMIAGVATGVTALIGAARRGPCNRAVRIDSVGDFERQFGGLAADCELGYAVRQFFLNGGTSGWAVRVPRHADTRQWLQGLNSLAAVDRFNLLVLPGLADPEVLAAAADTCRQRTAFLIADAPADARTPALMAACVQSRTLPRTSYGGVYFPWVRMDDPLAPGTPRIAPPGAAVAGLFARTDDRAGIWKAPAGPEAFLQGVQGLECAVDTREAGELADLGVNCLRPLPGGIAVGGARTLDGDARSNSDWRYVPVRRLALYLEESLDCGTRWAAFEPNQPALWAELRAAVESFMQGLFDRGAFMGTRPDLAYLVRCDETTTTQADIEAGEVNIEVRFAPLEPAEFVIVTIRQMTAPPACPAPAGEEERAGDGPGVAAPPARRSRGLRPRRPAPR